MVGFIFLSALVASGVIIFVAEIAPWMLWVCLILAIVFLVGILVDSLEE